MKLTCKQLSFGKGMYVNGGHIVRAAVDLVVPKAGYSMTAAEGSALIGQGGADPGSVREGAEWVNAKAGDIAIEIINPRKENAIVGYYFLSGDATNIVLYTDRTSPAEHWRRGIGWRVDPSMKAVPEDRFPALHDDLVASMMRVKYGEADVVTFWIMVPHVDEFSAAAHSLSSSFAYEPDRVDVMPTGIETGLATVDGDGVQTHLTGALPNLLAPKTHLIGVLEHKRPTHGLAVLHCQAEPDYRPFCAKGFATELLRTSKCMVERPFWHMLDLPKIDRVRRRLLDQLDDTNQHHPDEQEPAHLREVIEALPDRGKFMLLDADLRKGIERQLKEFGL
jgi:hypothetical protein